ncbi:MAG: hypothetical protein KBA28_10805 [Syntrophaceae bacterium]|nr:hypothetical protein [Syntrophaceae bacterium]
MKIMRTRWVSRRRLAAINLFGVVFAPKGEILAPRTLNHEAIHTAQMKEMLFIFFYLWYFLEWLFRLRRKTSAYRRISFEREAYYHEHDKDYLKNRKPYHWIRYLSQTTENRPRSE